MDSLEIKRQKSLEGGPEHYLVPAVALMGPGGKRRLIPNPQGVESALFSTLEEATEAVLRAGFQPVFEDRPVGKRGTPFPRALPQETTLEEVALRLEAKLHDTAPQVVAQAATALGEFRFEGSLKPLLSVFAHEDGQVRKAAAESVAKYGLSAIAVLRKALQSPQWVIRHTAVLALGDMLTFHREAASTLLPDLTAALEDEQWLVRSQAAQALALAGRILREGELLS